MFMFNEKVIEPDNWLNNNNNNSGKHYHYNHRRHCHYWHRIQPTNSILVLIIGILIIGDQVLPLNGYSSGAPNSRKVCTTLIPGHGLKQNLPSPFNLTLNELDDHVVALDLVATIQATFAGFIVQARNLEEQNEIIDGHFIQTSNNTHLKSCISQNQNTWTHRDGEPKTKVATNWSPMERYTGAVNFIATVVQVKQAYWDNIKSRPIYFIDGKITDEATYYKTIAIDNDEVGTNNGESQKSFQLNYNDCNNKLCIGLGQDEGDCFSSKTCSALFSVSKNDLGENEFNIHAKPGENPNSVYYSMAFSEDDKMGDDFVVDCFLDSAGTARIGLSYNKGKSNDVLTNNVDQSILTILSARYLNGVLQCNWKLKEKFTVNKKEYDLKNSYHIFLASGSLENDNGEKQYHDIRTRTPRSVDLAYTGSLETKNLKWLIRVHGSLMLITWFGTVPTAIILARYFKNAWPGRTICGVQVWFAFHRFLMVLSLCLMSIAQISIFYYLGEYRVDLHQIFGSIAFILALLQPLGALFRPHPGAPKRWLFNWLHWMGGTVSHITAAAAILLASKLKLANLSESFLYVAVVWVLCHVVMHLIFQFYSFCTAEIKSTDIVMQEMHKRNFQRDKPKNGFNYFLLTFYIILIIFLLSVLVLFVTFPNIVNNLI